MYIKSTRIYTPEECIKGIIHIEDGKIAEILPYDADVKDVYDAGENRIIPGIFDTHNHGTLGYSASGNADSTEEDIWKHARGYVKGLASQGVTGVLPTTTDLRFYPVFVKMAKEGCDGAKVLGIHSEGPYTNRVGENGDPIDVKPIDLNVIQEYIDKGEGYLKLMALAPELENAKEAVKMLNDAGSRVAMCHTEMMYREALESFTWGISVITHTCNVMRGIHHRRMGALGAALLDDDVYNEVICDGKHNYNEMLEIIFRIKRDPYNKFMMISDCSNLSGAPVGKYQMNENWPAVNITPDGFALSDKGRLCGSTMPVLKGMGNLVENMGIAMKYAIRMASLNPSKVYGYTNKGSIEVGKDADIIVIDNYYNCLYTISEGKCVYDREKEGDVFNPEFIKKNRI